MKHLISIVSYSMFRKWVRSFDRAELEAYWANVASTLESVPIKVLSAFGPHLVLEAPDVEAVVIADFPRKEAACQ